jgi:hypothetical protein
MDEFQRKMREAMKAQAMLEREKELALEKEGGEEAATSKAREAEVV